MLKAIIGMIKWKRAMKKLANMKPYSDEWWDKMTEILYFVPAEQREEMMGYIVMAGCAM